MCLITFRSEEGAQAPFVLIANRDEAYQRESLPIHFWKDHPTILGGRDMKAGGTWLAITTTGRFAALTNQPFTEHVPVDPISRGGLITDFLANDVSVLDYVKQLRADRKKYEGYHLVFGAIDDLYRYDNVRDEFKPYNQEVHSLSNTKDDLSKYRQLKSEAVLAETLAKETIPELDNLIELFQDTMPNPDLKDYPQALEKEVALKHSSIFIQSNPDFGTVSTTAIVINREGQVSMKEVRYSAQEIIQVTEEKFVLERD